MHKARKEFMYWDPETDTSNSWNGSTSFQMFLAPFGVRGRKHWRNFKLSAANMVAWNKGKWGPDYLNLDARGGSVTWPGGSASIWSPHKKGKILNVHQWKRGKNWKKLKKGVMATDPWYYKP
jgi:hypothetical protein